MFSIQRPVRRTLALKAVGSSLLLGGALFLGGCGGGGSGPSVPKATATPVPTPVASNVLMAEEFNAGALDANRWAVLGNSIQRTLLGNKPTFDKDSDGTRFVRVPLHTFVPDPVVRQEGKLELFGTEFGSKTLFPQSQGLKFESRMRFTSQNQPGLVGAMFLFSEKGTYGGTPPLTLDEVDHELLSNSVNADTPYTWTNIYNDFITAQPDGKGGTLADPYDGNPTKTLGAGENLVPGFDKGGWNTYRIEWKPGSVQWFINDKLIRTDTSSRVPDSPLSVRFNIWGAASQAKGGWNAAYSDQLQPAASASADQTFSLDVDWLHVETLDGKVPSTSSALLRSSPASGDVPMAGYSSK
jgi:hypothetical protein